MNTDNQQQSQDQINEARGYKALGIIILVLIAGLWSAKAFLNYKEEAKFEADREMQAEIDEVRMGLREYEKELKSKYPKETIFRTSALKSAEDDAERLIRSIRDKQL